MPDATEKVVLEGDPDPRELEQLRRNEFADPEVMQRWVETQDPSRTPIRQEARAALAQVYPGASPTAQPQPQTNPLLQQGQKTLSDYEAAIAKEQMAREKSAQAMQPEYQSAIQQLEEARKTEPQWPQVPILGEPPKREQYIDQTAAKSLFAVASLIAGLGMAGGRGRGMLAMSGITGAIKGLRENNAIKYNAAMDQYKTQISTQVQQYRMMHDDYLNEIAARHDNIEMMFQELDLKARMYNDPVMQAAAQVKEIDGALKHTYELGRLQNELLKSAGKPLGSMPLERQRWEIAAKALGYDNFDAAPAAVQNQIMQDVAGLRARAYQQEREKYQQWVRTNAPVQPKDTINWLNQTGQSPDSDAKFKDPAKRTPQELIKSGYVFYGDLQVARAYRQSMQALTQLKRIENDVNELYKGVGPGENIANAVALKIKRGMGEARALQLKRTILETLPTMALAEGMTAGRVGEAILGEFELPQFPTDRDTYDSAMTAINTLRQRLGNNIQIFRGTGVHPELVEQATGLATQGQQPTPGQSTPSGKPKIIKIEPIQ